MNKNVVSPRHLPARWPIMTTVVIGLLLDRCDAPGWVWGVCGAFVFLWFVLVFIVTFWAEEYREPEWNERE